MTAFLPESNCEDDMRMLWIATACLCVLTTGPANLMVGQNLPAPSPPWANRMPGTGPSSSESQADRQAKIRNAYQQKQLAADAEKLLKLTTELKLQVDKSTKDTPSVDAIRKAGKIEKLAHNIEQDMRR